jgi:hypothetical protein
VGRSSKGMKRTVLAIGLACGCQSDRHFHTVAVYEAPGSSCLIRMEADGVVRSGADLSDQSSAILTVGATTAPGFAGHARVNLRVTLRQGQVHLGSESTVQGTLPSRTREALVSLLSEAGCAPVSEEVEEVWSAIEGVLFGPKGTLMSGQTSVLKVLSTSFDR